MFPTGLGKRVREFEASQCLLKESGGICPSLLHIYTTGQGGKAKERERGLSRDREREKREEAREERGGESVGDC